MRYGKLKAGLAVAGMLAGMTVLAVQPAYADYAPNAKDVVGVGSDTLQYLVDFAADGDYLGDPGYNSAELKYKLISFDATADANARLAYGAGGANGTGNGDTAGQCPPGDGPSNGTGNQTSTHADSPCTLNPTIVLRAGESPIVRPNGSGAGAKALLEDSQITFSRASAPQGTADGGPLGSAFDSITVGEDPLAMLETTTPVSNAVPLSASQLLSIYTCQGSGTNGAETWQSIDPNDTATGATDAIIPIIPQVGSGTRTTFLEDIGMTSAEASAYSTSTYTCVQTGEENDPTALSAQSKPQDAIEPMSGGRLNLFLGLLGGGASNQLSTGGYFKDPSCPVNIIATAGTTGACAPENLTGNANVPGDTVSPAVQLITSGTPYPTGGVAQTLFDVQRPLYIYFRDSGVSSTAGWQPGSAENQIRTLFYDPCPDPAPTSTDGCSYISTDVLTNGVETPTQVLYGPDGQPWFATGAAQTDIMAAGILPTYVPSVPGA